MSQPMNIESFLELAKSRRMVRSYQAEMPSAQAVNNVIEAGRWAPSAYNVQPWKFIIIKTQAQKEQIAAAVEREIARWKEAIPGFAGQVPAYLTNAPVLVAVVGDKKFNEKLPANRKGASEAKLYYSSMAAAVQNMHLAAAAQGLGTVQFTVGCEEETQKDLQQIFALAEDQEVLYILPLGNPADRASVDDSKRRLPVEQLCTQETYTK